MGEELFRIVISSMDEELEAISTHGTLAFGEAARRPSKAAMEEPLASDEIAAPCPVCDCIVKVNEKLKKI